MTTMTGSVLPADSGSTTAKFVDRWMYVFTAGLFLAAVLAGFVPSSFRQIEALEAGRRLPFPPILHVHAVLMGSWIMLLLAQSLLMATNRSDYHKQLGLLAFVLAPALVIAGIVLVQTTRIATAHAILDGPAVLAEALRPGFERALNNTLTQLRIGVMFVTMIGIGICARRRDPELHKRLMFLGTAPAVAAGLDRIRWLPAIEQPFRAEFWPLCVLAPMLLWDVYRTGKLHRAYVIYLALAVVCGLPVHMLWGTAWWRETALATFGIRGI